ncbi:alpha/beta fold hydrolase [Mycolicibacterium sp. HS_4_1]
MLLVHGLFVNSTVWEPLVALLDGHVRCVMPDLPMGAHTLPMNGADLSPPALAALLAEFIEHLQLTDVTVVGNDTGGALCQILSAHYPRVIDRLVLTNCDAFEHFPPTVFRPLEAAGGAIPGLIAGLDLLLRVPLFRRAALTVVPVTMRPLPDELLAAWFAPLHDHRIRADVRAVLQGISARHTLDAADRLRHFTGPALIAWGARDRFFPLSDAARLTQTFPHARLEVIDDARTYIQLDQPQRLADLIIEHMK